MGVRTDQRWDAGVGVGAGQRGSTAMARRSLAIVQLFDIRVSLGVGLGAKQDGGGSQPEERHGVAAGVHKVDRRRKKHGTEGFEIDNFCTQHFFRSGDSISEFDQPLPRYVPIY
jgi:hypothetical protein